MKVSTKDRCKESPAPHMAWKKVSVGELVFPWNHESSLKVKHARQAVDRIEQAVRPFPFQIRYAMALPYWYRFGDMYCATGGDVEKALSEIPSE